MQLNDLLKTAIDSGASDLHVKAGSYPMMRVRGALTPASEERRLEEADLATMAEALLSPDDRQRFEAEHEVDLAYSVPGLGRFRCSVFRQRGSVGLILRVIPAQIASLDALNLPKVLSNIAVEERGLVLVTGTTGSGKSTTLAALVTRSTPRARRTS